MVEEMISYLKILKQINLVCKDDGLKFIEFQKMNAIIRLLNDYKVNLNNLFAEFFVNEKAAIILSSHIDSVYSKTFTFVRNNIIYGTLDNSISNAAIIYLMVNKPELFSNVKVVFTGNEENGFGGAKAYSSYINKNDIVITADVTFNERPIVKIENPSRSLDMKMQKFLKNKYDREIIDYDTNYSSDETEIYSIFTCNTLSLSIPINPIQANDDNWMHSEFGQWVDKKIINQYLKFLEELILFLSVE